MKRLALAVALLASALLAAAQSPKTPQPQSMPPLVESIDVRVINIDVVVTDKKGKPVTGLKKEDFELYENGQLKPISNFYEVDASQHSKLAAASTTPGATPAAEPAVSRPEQIPDNQKRRIIFYIDNLSLAPFNRNRVFKSMKDFIHNVMRPGDEAMIATFNRSMKVRVPFTRDPVQLEQTLDIIAGESAMGTNNKSERQSAESQIRDAQSYDDALATARTYAESVQHDLRTSVESLNALMSTLAGVEGKKVLVLTSEGFPMQPGREMFTFLDEQAAEKGWQKGGTLLEGMSFDSHDEIASVARSANANGITLYTIHAAGLAAGFENSAENARPTSFNVSQAALTNSTDSMYMMADLTGGLASIQTNNFQLAFDRIKSDLDSYYSLGYRAGTDRVDRQRNVQVRVKNRNYVARSRQTFVEKSTFAEMSDRTVANLLYRTRQNDLHVAIRTGQPRVTDDELYRVPVEVQIPMDLLTFMPQGETEFAGGFDVYVCVANKDNDMSDVQRQSQQIHIPKEQMATIKGKYYTYSMDLIMEPGLNKLSVGVVDSISNVTGFAWDQIVAKDLR